MAVAAHPEIDATELREVLQQFLAEAREATVLEDGGPLFELRSMRYSVSGEHGKCLLHMWSPERNTVRRVLEVQRKGDSLVMKAQRFGQPRPSRLEICLKRDRRAPSARKACRAQYQQRLQAIVEREFSGWKLDRLSSAMDLEHSLGPEYARGLLRRGGSAFAVLGTNADESQGAVDGSVTAGVLWMDRCRREFAARGIVEGLKLFCPGPRSGQHPAQGEPPSCAMAAARLASLDRGAAKWQLYSFDEREASIEEVDCTDRGNVATRLVHCPDEAAARERFAASIARVRGMVPDVDVAVASAGEIGFRVRGLEFARARMAPQEPGFRLAEEICFGVGAAETVLSDETAAPFANLARRIVQVRRPDGDRNHPLYRMQPERWLEALVARDVQVIDPSLDRARVYSQVPAFSASDRAVIDVLGVTRDGRLAVIELKADEDLHLPMQGLDYWARVCWHQQRGEFQRFGYFPGVELSPEPPLLYLVAPAFHVHPTTDTLLRYIAPEIEICVVGVDEHWRERLRVVFRKRRARAAAAY